MAFRPPATVARRLLLIFPLAFLTLSAPAAELVTLHNGFALNCSSRESISPDTVRLHLNAEVAGVENYLDVPAASIATVEATADVAVPVAAPATARPAALAEVAQRSGETHNLNVALLLAVIHAESAGNAHAVSRTGARGLMQLMPGTAAELGVTDTFSPAANVNGGSTYLDRLLTRYHENITLALAAYNAGPAAVDRYHGIPPYRETQLYVARVIKRWNSLVAAQRKQADMSGVASR